MRDATSPTKLPKNFMVYFPNFDEEKRRNKLRDDEEYELSLRSVLHSKRTFHPIWGYFIHQIYHWKIFKLIKFLNSNKSMLF